MSASRCIADSLAARPLPAALDAMTGLLYEDDSQVAEVRAAKAFGLPRAEFAAEAIA